LEGRRLFLTGSNHESTRLYEALERAGFVVVGEDHDWGDRYYADPVDEGADWLDALTDRAMFGAPAAAKYGLAERVRYVCGRARLTRAEVVLSLNRRGDDAARWEFPDLQSALRDEGILCECIDDLPFDATDETKLVAALESLGEPVK
jgi:benzoyl-CoA reductase/2-hydroxyglutaryl-CoA dehydratase subunit BcrC/BadD/HgdB